ncbi:MAG: hypothetical protein IIB99_02505 [Planctomycetes bacterium]|nr:hypothetical protein [Planctomycetota bacterium]
MDQCTGPGLADALTHQTTRQRSGVGATVLTGDRVAEQGLLDDRGR